jgi:hypothetical protein
MNLTIPYSPQKAAKTLFSVVLFLVSADIAGQVSKYFFGHERLLGFVKLFDLNREGTIPSWYSSITLLLCAFLLANITSLKKHSPYRTHWKALSFIFLYLSVDEAAELHERWNYLMKPFVQLIKPFVQSSELLYAPWVVPGAIFVAIILISYVKFLNRLPKQIKWLFLIAGTVYVTGAVGMELVENYLLGNSGGVETFFYQMIVVIEEFYEMFGIIIFIYALLSYLERIIPNSPSLDTPQENKMVRYPLSPLASLRSR